MSLMLGFSNGRAQEGFEATVPGQFQFVNVYAPTRIGTLDGPLAGRGIWGQMEAGLTADALFPIGRPAEHVTNGLLSGGIVSVPGTRPCEVAYVRMVAWDGRLWGTALAGVPPDQLGATDTILMALGGEPLCETLFIPPFHQPAVVPVTEPHSLTVLLLGSGGVALFW
jgi:hypothetical protein